MPTTPNRFRAPRFAVLRGFVLSTLGVGGVFLFLAVLQGVQTNTIGPTPIIPSGPPYTPPEYQPLEPPPEPKKQDDIKIDDPEPPITPPTLETFFPEDGGVLPPIAIDTEIKIRLDDDIIDALDAEESPRPIITSNPRVDDRLRGTVVAECVVETDGRVTQIRVLNPPSPFLANAIKLALRQWRFEPGRHHGEPARVRVRIPFRFQ